jgi:hypothetical protein
MNLAGDFELWARFFEHAELYGTHSLLGGFRVHGDQKTGHHYDEYCREAQGVLSRYALPKRGYCRSALQRLLRATGFRKPGKWSTYRVEYDFQNDRWKSFRMSIPAVFPAFPS